MILTIYSKPGCHLCDDMKGLVVRVLRDRGEITLEEVDISNDARLRELYESEIPVLMIDGKKVAKYRISEGELVRRLDAETG